MDSVLSEDQEVSRFTSRHNFFGVPILKMTLNKLVKAAIFSSTAIGLGFVFMFIPNLEFISVTVFLSGLTLGGYIGAIVGGTSMLVYSGLNPLGSGLIHLPFSLVK